MANAGRILIADDDPVTVRFVGSLLRNEGYEVFEARDGDEAHRLALEHLPDVVVCDLLMPYRDGYELLRAVRTDARLAHVPVIILSMKDREEDIVRGFEEGADDYVVKPFHARELVARIRKQFERRRTLG